MQQMGLKRSKGSCKITGIGAAAMASGIVEINLIHHAKNTEPIAIKALIVKTIARRSPDKRLPHVFDAELQEQELADPVYYIPGKIEMLFGAGFWASIVCDTIKRKNSNKQQAIAQLTQFGWVIYGHINTCSHLRIRANHLACEIDDIRLDKLLIRFWDGESMRVSESWTPSEQEAEDIFTSTHSRDQNGRYIVRIPTKSDAPPLGSSRASAKACYFSMERKFNNNPELKAKYKAVFDDYRGKRHMVLAAQAPTDEKNTYYLPHHAINSATSPANKKGKFRVVFNASAKTTTGYSFNDIQLTGPKLQDDLNEIFLRFRMRKYAFSADITQMFRQIQVHPLDWNYQRVFWRDSIHEPLEEYIITVVTWGMASAGFNAIRALRQCAIDEANRFPLASEIVLNDFYFDDMLSGANDEQALTQAYHQMNQMLAAGGFELAKWTTNSANLAVTIMPEESTPVNMPIESSVLGMQWIPKADVIRIKSNIHLLSISDAQLTKRKILSMTAQIYDPSGLIAPVIVSGKILQQDLWRAGMGWDEPISQRLLEKWQQYKANVMSLDKITIPRWVQIEPTSKLQLHIFTDASELAMGAAAYIRTTNIDGHFTANLLTSKTKVAPIKKLTMPRLELGAATIGAQLYQAIKRACHWKDIDVHFWSDSTIVIYWIRRDPALSKPYVAHRVLSIRQQCEGAIWRHVEGGSNPADLLTRGFSADQLKDSDLWWHGPQWLASAEEEWPVPAATSVPASSLMDMLKEDRDATRTDQMHGISATMNSKSKKGNTIVVMASQVCDWLKIQGAEGEEESILSRQSKLSTLLRISAMAKRFIDNTRNAMSARKNGSDSPPLPKRTIPFKTAEFPAINSIERREALMYWVKNAQAIYYGVEIRYCREGRPVPTNSGLAKLVPFLDRDGVLRVGGRLSHAAIPEDAKHQAILPPHARLSQLIIADAHAITLHGGAQLMIAHLRRSFWITRMRQVVKSLIHHCPTCIRYAQATNDQLMGNLPAKHNHFAIQVWILQALLQFGRTHADHHRNWGIRSLYRPSKHG